MSENENENPDPPDDEAVPDGAELDPKEQRKLRKAAKSAERSPLEWRMALRKKVRMFYDLQRLRIQAAGRGQKKGEENPIQLHEIDVAVLDQRSADLARSERAALNDIKDHLASSKFYTQVLSDKTRFKGLGPTLAAVVMSEYDITNLDNASRMWSFGGLAPVASRRCKRCHGPLNERKAGGGFDHAWKSRDKEKKCPIEVVSIAESYESGRAMRPEKGEKLPYNAFLKTKLVGVLGPCLIKANSPWRKCYDDYKHRKASAGWGMSDGHRHQAAIRYMVKQLLLEVWREWRTFEGLPVREPYAVEYLGKRHDDPQWSGREAMQ